MKLIFLKYRQIENLLKYFPQKYIFLRKKNNVNGVPWTFMYKRIFLFIFLFLFVLRICGINIAFDFLKKAKAENIHPSLFINANVTRE